MTAMDTFDLHPGSTPLLISLPHDGSAIPEPIATRMTPMARRSPDTDWHVGQLYDFARELGAGILKPHYSRYVVDLNRPADGHAMYPGRRETGLVSTIGFSGEPLYRDGAEPDAEEIAQRVKRYWQPYHDALRDELARLRDTHGRAVLWEGHSIRGQVPMLFEGRLPDLNLGTNSGASCRAELADKLQAVLAAQTHWSHVRDQRFKGGYNTRHYGTPDEGIDAVQLEMVQALYMDEDSFAYLPERAARVQPLLRQLLQACLSV